MLRCSKRRLVALLGFLLEVFGEEGSTLHFLKRWCISRLELCRLLSPMGDSKHWTRTRFVLMLMNSSSTPPLCPHTFFLTGAKAPSLKDTLVCFCRRPRAVILQRESVEALDVSSNGSPLGCRHESQRDSACRNRLLVSQPLYIWNNYSCSLPSSVNSICERHTHRKAHFP